MKIVLGLIFCLSIVQGLPKNLRYKQESCESRQGLIKRVPQENTGSNQPYEIGVEAKNPNCTACAIVVNLVQYYARSGRSKDEIFSKFEDICKDTEYMPPQVCGDYINLIGEELLIIMRETTNTPLEICSFLEPRDCGSGDVPGHRWTVELPSIPKPPIGPIQPPDTNTPKLKVLQIADTHYDPKFVEGTVDNCELELCCRLENGIAQANESAAGKWGGWKCDIPERTLDSMLEHAKKTHTDISYVVWTGDYPPHNTFSQTKEESLYLLNSTVSKVKQYFPDVPVFPALGNHEPSPPHNFPPPIINRQKFIQWYYDELVKQWSKFLPESTFDTIRAGGYYIAEVRPGFKIISLNTNYCYFENWWLILNSTDPGNMLKWFVEELQKAENNDEIVHVIAHVPPGYSDCLKVFAQNYYRIIDRYENTVTAQFFGHTHTDEIEVYYDAGEYNMTRPVAIGYVAPSVTTHVNLNPGYRVYSVDGDGTKRFVENFETWVMDLRKTNEEDNPNWYKLFTAKESYNLANLLPEEWNKFYERLKTDDQLLNTYDRNYWKNSPKRGECGAECRRARLCDIRSCILYGEPTSL